MHIQQAKILNTKVLAISLALHSAVLFYMLGPVPTLTPNVGTPKSISVTVTNAQPTQVASPEIIKPQPRPKKSKTQDIPKAQEPVPTDKADTTVAQAVTTKFVADATTAYAPAPEYPRMARLRGLVGNVILRLGINEQGQVIQTQITKTSGHEMLDQAALEALKQWRFQIIGESKSIAYWTEKVVEFRLED